ncbi:MAG: hypothetical protein KBG48_11405 [Kofleriaceae bacterium]|nr:hypothetical protein [Kofleriaceae bacterium]MBP9167991.1 hypothetical protein [Kofleriaceae bacterium]MBP9856825.1 hypothetical protein [Kofleriaceae bacterium]
MSGEPPKPDRADSIAAAAGDAVDRYVARVEAAGELTPEVAARIGAMPMTELIAHAAVSLGGAAEWLTEAELRTYLGRVWRP